MDISRRVHPGQVHAWRGRGRRAVDHRHSKQQEANKVMMMPFGAGRRICPWMGYAMLHLDYFLANLITDFEWRRPTIEGEQKVDLEADHGFFTSGGRRISGLGIQKKLDN
jgi:cytochrome P450